MEGAGTKAPLLQKKQGNIRCRVAMVLVTSPVQEFRMYLRLSTLVTALILCSAANAQKLYFSLYTGNTQTRRSDLHLTNPALGTNLYIRGVGFDAHPLKTSLYYGLRVGTFFKKRSPLGLDLELRHYKAYGRVNESRPVDGRFNGTVQSGVQPVNNFVQKYNVTNGVSSLALNLQYRWMLDRSTAFDEGRIQPYISAGPTFYILWPFNLVNNREGGGANYRGAGFGYQGHVGVRYGLAPHWNVFTEIGYSEGDKKHIGIAQGGRFQRQPEHLSSEYRLYAICALIIRLR